MSRPRRRGRTTAEGYEIGAGAAGLRSSARDDGRRARTRTTARDREAGAAGGIPKTFADCIECDMAKLIEATGRFGGTRSHAYVDYSDSQPEVLLLRGR